jgi:hypothetical protein
MHRPAADLVWIVRRADHGDGFRIEGGLEAAHGKILSARKRGDRNFAAMKQGIGALLTSAMRGVSDLRDQRSSAMPMIGVPARGPMRCVAPEATLSSGADLTDVTSGAHRDQARPRHGVMRSVGRAALGER